LARLTRPQPRAQAVADELRVLVKERRLVPGDRLPSENELVELLGVGRSSVREGIQLLESLGIVDVEHGKGTFLASTIGGGLRRVIDWAYQDSDSPRLIHDLSEARVLVETMQARLAAERATDEELAELKARFGSEEHLRDPDPETAGVGFHAYVARIAHNDILLIMSNAVRPLYTSLVADLPRPAAEIQRLIVWHTKIVDAIVARDADAAAAAMEGHLADNYRQVDAYIAKHGEPTLGGR
jgi:DNA-binding FadR family transcriptional regulator